MLNKLGLLNVLSNKTSISLNDSPYNEQPKFAFYFSQGDLNTPMHYLVWEDYLNKLNTPYMIILREKKHLNHFKQARYKHIKIVFCRTANSLLEVVPNSVTTIFYANNGFKNIEMINRHPALRHVQLLHGDSDKKPSYNPTVRCFTDLFVSGDMAIDRYKNNGVYVNPSAIKVVGRPQAANINVIEQPNNSGDVTIGFMPTWLGYHEETQLSSLKLAPKILETIAKHDFGLGDVKILFKAHPLSYVDPDSQVYFKQINDIIACNFRNQIEVIDQKSDALSILNASDVLITDISSVAIDYLYSKKPYIITNPNNFNLSDLNKYPCVRGAYVLDTEANLIIKKLNDALNEDNLKEVRMQVRNYAFGDTNFKPGELFQKTCLEIINGTAA